LKKVDNNEDLELRKSRLNFDIFLVRRPLSVVHRPSSIFVP
jgi:hypothetical protein